MNLLSAARGLLLALTAFASLGAIADVAVPPLTARVTDMTGTLTREQQASLDQTLQAFEAKKGAQVAILIVPTTQPETIEQYSLRVVEQWKLGRKRVDDGALLIIAKDDRTLRIEVGYGLEGVLTDAASKRIISEDIVPRFKQRDFYGGVAAGVDRMLGVIGGEPLPPPKETAGDRGDTVRQLMPILLVLTLVLGGVLRSMLGRFPGAVATGGAVGVVAWMLSGAIFAAIVAAAIALLFTLLGGGHMGLLGIGGRSGGRSGSGGFGGGGGGFGGGGASGKW
ncbi:TPM domain-containing protein [Cupriavidus basilensis]|uniref:Beta-propeller domains of methanol dehydrogenase type n=1 Tax=Cupriavidus basilensis TaxID=68895 RepID=A0A0C4YNP3_9BURK|nr:YgcG family protein [Cupriavidus basilensis]AJG24633.1 Beta-propeller domains of methanol dehydrogenase type [Cupriavidus basilensis]